LAFICSTTTIGSSLGATGFIFISGTSFFSAGIAFFTWVTSVFTTRTSFFIIRTFLAFITFGYFINIFCAGIFLGVGIL
jgi:hypothetical protein